MDNHVPTQHDFPKVGIESGIIIFERFVVADAGEVVRDLEPSPNGSFAKEYCGSCLICTGKIPDKEIN